MAELKLGDRVRVRLPDEPDALDQAKGSSLGCHYRHLSAPVIGHTPYQHGSLGTVTECSGGFPCRFGSAIGHGYLVLYDAGYVYDGVERYGGHFAEDELEVV